MGARSDENPILERIERVLAELSRSIAAPGTASGGDEPGAGASAGGSAGDDAGDTARSATSARLSAATAWIRARACRDQALGDDLFFDPAWSILLELYVHHRQRTAMSITALCLAAKIPPSTGLRWVTLLEKRGLVTREADPFDKRKSYARLTPAGVGRIERALDDAIDSFRRLEIGRGRLTN